MTALDPAPVIARLRDQRHCTGVYDPDTVEELIATVESTGELRADALASVVPLRRRPPEQRSGGTA